MTEATRSTALAVLHALPAIGLISFVLWMLAGASAAALAFVIDLDVIGLVACAVLFLPPTIWANWHVVRLAVASERTPAP